MKTNKRVMCGEVDANQLTHHQGTKITLKITNNFTIFTKKMGKNVKSEDERTYTNQKEENVSGTRFFSMVSSSEIYKPNHQIYHLTGNTI